MKNILIIGLKILLTSALLFLILRNVDIKNIVHLIQNSSLFFFLLALLVVFLQNFVTAMRWNSVLSHQKIHIGYRKVLSYFWIGLFFNQALPSSIGGDALKGYYLYKRGFSVVDSTLGVLLDRVLGMIGLVILVVVALPLFFKHVDDVIAQLGVLAISLGSLLLIVILLILDFLPKTLFPYRMFNGLRLLSTQGRKLIFSTSAGSLLILISIVIHLFSIFAVMLLSQGMGMNLSLVHVLIVVPIVILIMTIPISIAGWGVREGVMVIGFGYLGIDSEQVLALSILYGILALVSAIPGIIIWLFNDHLVINKRV